MRRRLLPNLLIALIVIILAGGAYTFLKDMDGPTVTISPKTDRISPMTQLTIGMEDKSGIRELELGIRKDNEVKRFFRKHYDEYVNYREEVVPLREANLTDGAFELVIKVTDASMAGFGHGNTHTESLPMRLDAQPPRLSIKTLPPNVRRGGAAVVRFTADEEVTNCGVLINNWFVPAYLQKDGSWVCLYPYPYAMTPQDYKNSVQITATDLAGNNTTSHLTVLAYDRRFRNDKLNISDSFLQQVQSKLGNLAPNAPDPLQCYLTINTQVRAQNIAKLQTLSHESASAMLFDGVFIHMPRAATRANFADHRTLIYQNQVVGEAYHLGLDLASVRNAEIPAANSGKVVFTGDMGVYGNLCLIDHGLGLFSLYAHMNDFTVKPGDLVKKGDLIGHTDSTGLAFGDHLHFGIIVGGLEVTPIEWLDPKWVRNIVNNINGTVPAR